MSQYTINIGALPNDGTGDPLRTAFNEVNLNFNQVFAAGPVLSNIQIANNSILTTNTNGNLVLAPNGVGKIVSATDIIPSVDRARNLGSLTNRWRTVYTQYVTVYGDATIGGNLSVTGNVIQIGNIVTDSLTIQLANTAGSANAANGSGITVGANDNIATLLYNSTGNIWTTNIGVSAVGNISAPYFIGNGALLTGISAGANIGNITFDNINIIGNGNINLQPDANNSSAYLDIYLTTGPDIHIAGNSENVIIGRDEGANVLINANGAVSIQASSGTPHTWTFDTNGEVTLSDGTLMGAIEGAGSFGFYNPENSTTFIFETNSNYWQFNGNNGNLESGGGISVAGNITGNYILGNGSQLTGINASSNKIFNGTSSANIEFPGGNLAVGINLQPVTGAWINTYGNIVVNDSGDTAGESVIIDAGGNVYVTGAVFNTEFNNDQAYVRKLDSNGTVLWQKGLPNATDGSDSSSGETLAIDGSGNIYWLSLLWGNTSGIPLVAKLDPSTGEAVWTTMIIGATYAYDMTVNAAGQVFVVTNNQGRITSLDTNGAVLWSFDPSNGGTSIVDTGTFVIIGYSQGTVAAYDYSGNLLWANQVFNINQEVWGLAWDGTDWYASTVNGYITKISGADNSTILWQRFINRDGTSGNIFNTWIEYSGGYIYATGTGNVDGGYAFITVKIDASTGNLNWARSLEANEAGQWYWYGHHDISVLGDYYAITGYARPAQSNSDKQVLARLPVDGSLAGSTVGPYRYVNVPALTVDTVSVAGTGYATPGQPATVTTTSDTTLNTLVAPYPEVNILSPFTTGPLWSFNSDGSTQFPNNTIAGSANLSITANNHSWTFGNDGSFTPPTQPSNDRTGSGLTLKIGDTNSQAIITGPAPVANVYNAAPRLVVAGQDGVLDGEGGDIYLWAGRSGPDGGTGGDIKVDAGIGQNGSDGGTIKIRGGNSVSGAGSAIGGFVEIDAGSGNVGGQIYITAGTGDTQGGNANVAGGYAYNGPGGQVNIIGGGSSLGLPAYGNVLVATGASNWLFDNTGELNLPSGGRLGFAGKGWTGLDGGNGSPVSLTSFYANGFYAGCVTNNNDGNIIINTYTGDGLQGNWTFDNGANLVLAPTNYDGGSTGESAKLRGTRKIVNGYTNSYAYSTVLAAGGTPTVAYTATDNSVMSVKITFAVEGANGVWEQFDVSAVIDSTGNDVNFTVSNRVKRDNAIPDTVVTAAVDGSDRITISLNLDASQSTGWSSFDAVEFGLMAG